MHTCQPMPLRRRDHHHRPRECTRGQSLPCRPDPAAVSSQQEEETSTRVGGLGHSGGPGQGETLTPWHSVQIQAWGCWVMTASFLLEAIGHGSRDFVLSTSAARPNGISARHQTKKFTGRSKARLHDTIWPIQDGKRKQRASAVACWHQSLGWRDVLSSSPPCGRCWH